MTLEKMTIKQLKEHAEENGIDLKGATKKADIIAAINAAESSEEPEVVEAEIIEEQSNDLAINCTPGAITANFDALEIHVDEILAQYEGWEPSADSKEDVEHCARERKYLNSLAKKIDENRKSVKQEFLRPLNAFEARANSIRDKIKDVVERIKTVEDEAESKRRDQKREELMDHYLAYAGVLADVVTYDAIADEKWLNKTVSIEKAKAELEDKVENVAQDWETLKGLNLEFYEQAEIEFFRSLSLGQATSYAQKLAEDAAKIEAMKAEIEPEPEPMNEPTPVEAYGDIDDEPEFTPFDPMTCEPEHRPVVPQPVVVLDQQEPNPIPDAVPIPNAVPLPYKDTAAQIADIVRSFPPNKQENLLEALTVCARMTDQPVTPAVMIVDAANSEQLNAVGKFCGFAGVTGTFKWGTIDEVMNRVEAERRQAVYQDQVYAYGE